MGGRTPVYICLLCIALAFTAAHAQGRRSSQNSVELGDQRVRVDTAEDGSSVSTSSSAVGQNSASASATSVARSDGDKKSTFGAGSAKADGESVELAVASETPVQASQDTAEPPSQPTHGGSTAADAPAEAPAPEGSSTEAHVAATVTTKTQENVTHSNPLPNDELTVGAVEETSEESEKEGDPYKVKTTASGPGIVPVPEPSPEDPEHNVLMVTGDSDDSQEKNAPKCWGQAAHRCCSRRDVVTNRYGTFCGCPESYKKWGIGYCRFKMATNSPRTWQYVNRFSSRYGTSCQCDEEMAPVEDVVPVCSGIVSHQCCDYYDGSSDKCRCIFIGTEHEKCFWKKVRNSPLTWEDNLILRGRKCRCPGRL